MDCSRVCELGAAACWCCVANQGSERRRCSSTRSRRRRISGWSARWGLSRRWSWRSRRCISCARRCSTGWIGFPARSARRSATTFGLSAGAVPDRFLVGLAVLSLLSEAAEERPLLCVVDDAQWLDRASAQVLAFVARRLLAESVVIAVRCARAERGAAGLPELVVEGLRDADARALLASVIPGPLDERVREQIMAETRGNPLALLELPRGLTPAQLAGGFGLPGALSLSGRIEENFLQRLEALPTDTRRLLLVAAAEPAGDPALLWRAAKRLGIARTRCWSRAESAGCSRSAAACGFAIRWCARRSIGRQRRSNAGRCIARWPRRPTPRSIPIGAPGTLPRRPPALTRASPPSSSGRPAGPRHGAVSPRPPRSSSAPTALTPDPGAPRAARAGRGAEPSSKRARSTTLSRSSPRPRQARATTSSALAWICCALRSRSPRGAAATRPRCSSGRPRARSRRRGPRAYDLPGGTLRGTVRRPTGPRRRRERWRGRACRPPAASSPPRPSDLLLDGLAIRFTEGYAAAAPILKQALSAFRRELVPPPQEARWLWLACWAAADLWDDECWTLLSTRQLELARDAGALTAIPFVLSTRSAIHAHLRRAGRGRVAGRRDASGQRCDRDRRPPIRRALARRAAGSRGRGFGADRHHRHGGRAREEKGSRWPSAEFASAVLYNGLGRYDAALAAVRRRRRTRRTRSAPRRRRLAELIEAAARCGHRQLARARA